MISTIDATQELASVYKNVYHPKRRTIHGNQ